MVGRVEEGLLVGVVRRAVVRGQVGVEQLRAVGRGAGNHRYVEGELADGAGRRAVRAGEDLELRLRHRLQPDLLAVEIVVGEQRRLDGDVALDQRYRTGGD